MNLIPGLSALGTLKAILGIIVGLFVLFILVFALLNRSSDKVVFAILPAAGAVLATMLTINYTLESETKTCEFSTHLLFDQISKKPIWTIKNVGALYRPSLASKAFEDLVIAHPESLKRDWSDIEGLPTQFAIREVLETLFTTFPSHWDMKINRVRGVFPEGMRFVPFADAPRSDFITWDQLAEIMRNTPMLKARSVPFEKMGLPEGTVVRLSDTKPSHGLQGVAVSFENPFYKLDLSVAHSSDMMGVGFLTPILDITDEERRQVRTVEFLVEVRIEFNPLVQV